MKRTTMPAMWRVAPAILAAVLLLSGCSQDPEESADGDSRRIVDEHIEPDGRKVRVGLGEITYESQVDGPQTAEGLMIEVTEGDERATFPFPLPPIEEDYQVLGAFGGLGHTSVYRAPDGSVLRVVYRSGDEYEIEVGPDGLAVVVSGSPDALDRVYATGPDGTECRFLRAPYDGVDCEAL